jgi:hypothetical protein
VHNIEIDFRVLGWGDADWIELAQAGDQWMSFMNKILNIRVVKIFCEALE